MIDDGIIGTRLKIGDSTWLAIDRSETIVRLVTEDGRHGMSVNRAKFKKLLGLEKVHGNGGRKERGVL